MINTRKSTQELLQEEIFRERAAVLARAGERLTEAMGKLRRMEVPWATGLGKGETGHIES